ncbi:hypothetical protein GYA19_03885 [Candidatus Beckwithbacteria bacterium]|nr:hypothetical protein [Candidatus Beckwithbacteria bacterium]
MKSKEIIFILLFVFLFLLIIYFSRAVFVQKYNFDYIQDLFYESQWFVGGSNRIMSDNELYQFAGFRYLKGDSIFSVTPEVPPLGKYFFGLSIVLWNNPYYISIFLFILSFIAYYFLVRKFFKNQQKQFFALLFFLISPLIFQQVARTMLDLPQLLFFLLHLIFILNLEKARKNYLSIILAGISFGAFAACKFPVYILVIFVADIFYLYQKKILKLIIPISVVASLIYVLTFLPYFLQGHSLIEWIKAELWTINFYRTGGRQEIFLQKILSIILGFSKDMWGHTTYFQVDIWSILWPLSIVSPLVYFIKNKLRVNTKNLSYFYFGILSLIFFIFFIFFAFAPRYFILLLPLGIIFIVDLLWERKIVFYLLLLICFLQMFFYFRPSPTLDLYYLKENWEKKNYKDLYFQTLNTSVSQFTFREFKEQFENHNIPLKIEFEFDQGIYLFKDKAEGILTILKNGDSFKYEVQMRREDNKWKLVWNNDYFQY